MTPSEVDGHLGVSISPKSCSRNGLQTMTPALLTRMSTAPKRSITRSTQRADAVVVGQLQRDGDDVRSAEAEAALRDLLGLGAMLEVGERQPASRRGEAQRDLAADADARPRDEDALALRGRCSRLSCYPGGGAAAVRRRHRRSLGWLRLRRRRTGDALGAATPDRHRPTALKPRHEGRLGAGTDERGGGVHGIHGAGRVRRQARLEGGAGRCAGARGASRRPGDRRLPLRAAPRTR